MPAPGRGHNHRTRQGSLRPRSSGCSGKAQRRQRGPAPLLLTGATTGLLRGHRCVPVPSQHSLTSPPCCQPPARASRGPQEAIKLPGTQQHATRSGLLDPGPGHQGPGSQRCGPQSGILWPAVQALGGGPWTPPLPRNPSLPPVQWGPGLLLTLLGPEPVQAVCAGQGPLPSSTHSAFGWVFPQRQSLHVYLFIPNVSISELFSPVFFDAVDQLLFAL